MLKNNRTLLSIIVVSMLLVSLLILAYRADRSAGPAASIGVRTEFIGIWEGESGNLIELRPDGTGRARSRNDPTLGIIYLEWKEDSNSLDVIYGSSKRSFLKAAVRWVFGPGPTDRYDVTWITDDEMQLTDSAGTGESYIFERTSDSELAAAP